VKSLFGLVTSVAMMSCVSLSAQGFELYEEKFYAGGGLAFNSFDSGGYDGALGYQFFAGYDLSDDVQIVDKVGLSTELGYANSGNFKIKKCPAGFICDNSLGGLWVNAVFDYAIDGKVSAIGRAGFDFGEDDGLMLGIGAGYKIDNKLSARVEYVIRDHYSSMQANVVYDF